MHNFKQEALVEFIRDNQDKFYRLAYGYVHDRDTALDMVQDAVIRALEKVMFLRNPDYMRTWFYRILVNVCLTHLKRDKGRLNAEMPENMAEPVNHIDCLVEQMDLRRALSALSPEQKTLIMLRFWEDMKLQDIADVTGKKLSTVKAQLYRATRQLREEYEKASEGRGKEL
jgi:RNA polymerase sigma-70 factor (ECF subfamily)